MDCMSRNNPLVSSFSPSSPASDNELHHRACAGTHDPHYLPSPTSFTHQESSLVSPAQMPAVQSSQAAPEVPSICGLPLKYVSLVTLAVQNASLTIIMHYSRVSTTPETAYSAASAVLINEVLKGSISLAIAFARTAPAPSDVPRKAQLAGLMYNSEPSSFSLMYRTRRLVREIFSTDCWKLSIPAILYVIQNNLQYVAASNLDVATFQVTYQMKILTTAAFSVVMLRRRLTGTKWMALVLLALGVGIVQIQAGSGNASHASQEMNPLQGFIAVTAACFTSGLAGVYFEMVLKGSQADLWVRNVQLSLFSLLPALVPVFFSPESDIRTFSDIFRNFGFWAWATVLIQVFGGLVTAIVIKYSDNILKGFATSLSIIISFIASIFLFHFSITPSFVVGASTVLASTWMYNQPEKREARVASDSRATGTSYSNAPVRGDEPILGYLDDKKRSSSLSASLSNMPLPSPRAMADKLGWISDTSRPPSSLGGAVLGMSGPNSSAVSLVSMNDGAIPPLSRDHSVIASNNPYIARGTGWTPRPGGGISSTASSRAGTPPPMMISSSRTTLVSR